MTFKAVFPDIWPGTDQDMGVPGQRSGFGPQHTDFVDLCQRFTGSRGGSLMGANDQLRDGGSLRARRVTLIEAEDT
jgi:hypothetical protein